MTLRLQTTPTKKLIPLLSNVRGNLIDVGLEIGEFTTPHLYLGHNEADAQQITVEWRGTMAALATYERRREGKAVTLKAEITGVIHLLTSAPNQPLMLGPSPTLFSGQTTLTISPDAWATVLRELGIVDLVVVQIPLPDAGRLPPAVWHELQAARDEFLSGGKAGWRSCGVHLRQALDHWEDAQPLDLGGTPQNMTKEQRLDVIRKWLRHYTHITAHPAIAKDWTRDDALLALTAVCALLNATTSGL
jgi:hypothetical protein